MGGARTILAVYSIGTLLLLHIAAAFTFHLNSLSSVNCSSVRKFLQVFRLHCGQNVMKHPQIEQALEAYGHVFYLLVIEHCFKALLSCLTCAQLLLSVISKWEFSCATVKPLSHFHALFEVSRSISSNVRSQLALASGLVG